MTGTPPGRQEQRAAFKAELARLQAKNAAGTLTPAEQEALRRATTVRRRRIAAAESAKRVEATRIARAVKKGRDPQAARADRMRKPTVVRGRPLPPRITRVVGGGSPGQGKRA